MSHDLRFLNYGRHLLDESDLDAVVRVLRGDLITQGPVVEQFEAALAERCGARYAIAVSSGTAALHIATLAAGIVPGVQGITSALTFVASANCIAYAGGEPHLADIDRQSLGIAPQYLMQVIAALPNPRVVIPVHFAGLPHDAAQIRECARDQIIIEDASHSLGASYECGRPVGSCAYSDMTVFSFHPVKPITTGEGGAVLTNDAELAKRLRLLRNHGIERDSALFENVVTGSTDSIPAPWYYEQQILGFNYRITDLQAALGLSQLGKLGVFLERRRSIVARYDAAFANLPMIRRPQSTPAERARSGHHLYVVEIDFDAAACGRAEFMRRLAAHGVGTQVHYIPVYRQPYHAQRMADGADAFPAAEAYYGRCLSLPLHAGLSNDEVDRVVGAMLDAIDV